MQNAMSGFISMLKTKSSDKHKKHSKNPYTKRAYKTGKHKFSRNNCLEYQSLFLTHIHYLLLYLVLWFNLFFVISLKI